MDQEVQLDVAKDLGNVAGELKTGHGVTLEDVADRLAKKATDNPCSHPSCCPRTATVKADVLSALNSERERCAKIAEAMRPSGGRMWTDEQSACFEALTACAKEIRDQQGVVK